MPTSSRRGVLQIALRFGELRSDLALDSARSGRNRAPMGRPDRPFGLAAASDAAVGAEHA